MKKRKTRKSSAKHRNNINIVLFAVCAVMLMYAIVFLIYRSQSAEETGRKIKVSETTVPQTEYIETTEETTTALYNYEFVNNLDSSRISAKSAVLYNISTNTILFEKNADERCYPASTTKLMTALTALKKVKPDTVYTVGSEIQLIGEDSSSAYLAEGSQLTLESLLYAMLLPSGNDAAYTVAVNTARNVSGNQNMTNEEAVAFFCNLMNETAEEVGMENSNFANPDGYYKYNHYVTASDMLMLVKEVVKYPQIITAASSLEYSVTDTAIGYVYSWENNNKILFENSEYYFPYADGLKTGFTDEAGYCYVSSAKKDGTNLIALIFGSETVNDRYRDAKNLFNSIYNPSEISYAEVTSVPETLMQ